MSFKEYLHERAEESRHNETIAFMMFVAGAIFFVGGILSTLSLGQEPYWFVIIPYFTDMSAGAILGLALLATGIVLILLGIGASIVYSQDRGWYMNQLVRANRQEDKTFRRETARAIYKKKIDKK